MNVNSGQHSGEGESASSADSINLDSLEQGSHQAHPKKVRRLAKFAIDMSNEGIYIVRENGRFAYVNECAAQMLGYTREELCALSVPDIDVGIPVEDWKSHWQKTLQSNQTLLETQLMHKGGSLVEVEISVNLIEFNGQLLHCAFVRDITERIKSEQHVRMISLSLEKSKDPAFWMEHNGSFSYVNEAALEMTGFSREGFAQMKAYDFISEAETREQAIELWEERWQLYKKLGNTTFCRDVCLPDGVVVPLEVILNFIEIDEKEWVFGFARNVSDRVEAERQLHMLRASVESSGETVLLANSEGRLVYANEAAEQMLGYEAGELVGQNAEIISRELAAVTFQARFEQVKAAGSLKFEGVMNCKDGTDIPVYVSLNHVEFSGQEFIFASAHDISERHREEFRLRESEERFRAAFDSANSGMALVSTDGRWLKVNDALCRMVGYSEQDLLAMTFSMLTHPDDIGPDREIFEKMIQGEIQRCQLDKRYIHRNGSVVWVSISSATIRDSDGRVLYLVSQFKDITQRKRFEEALRDSENRFRSVVELASDAIVLLDAGGHVISWNTGAARIFGYSSRDIHEAPFLSLLDNGANDESLLKALASMTLEPYLDQNIQATGIRENGTTFPMEMSLSRWIAKSQSFYSFIIRDMTAHKKVEQDLRRAKETAEEATKVKSHFLANMSHEIRTPLNALIGMSGLLQDTPLNAEQADYVNTLMVSSKTLLSLVNDILDFSKAESGKMELEERPLDLHQCIEDAMELVSHAAAEKGLNLYYLIPEDIPEWIVGDVTRLKQVLLNLLSNAVKFTVRGQVTVLVEQQPLQDNRLSLHFSVTDTGIGIPQDGLTNIFEAFTQLETSTTRKYGGTGLGLAISNQLVKLMNGRMWVESEPGTGSTFHFTMQTAVVQDQSEVLPPENLDWLASKHALVMDGNETGLKMLALVCRKLQLDYELASDTATALGALETDRTYDFMLMCGESPPENGPGLKPFLQQVREQFPTLPVLVLSMSAHQTFSELCQSDTGPNIVCLTKPFRLHMFLKALKTLLCPPSMEPEMLGDVSAQPLSPQLMPLKLLLVEDNAINRKLFLKLLEQLGYTADIAMNGEEALAAVDTHCYDLIFMDVQMPVLDGLEATRQLCEKYPESERPKIIAMTAYALKEDRERCLEAGMDDYISKPISRDSIQAVLKKWGHQEMEIEQTFHEVFKDFSSDSVDVESFLNRIGGSLEILQELVEIFLKDTPELIERIHQNVEHEDMPGIRRTAHELKGICMSISTPRLQAIATHLEESAKLNDVAALHHHYEDLKTEYARVREDLVRIQALAKS